MTPLQKVAMGLVIVFLTARFAGWDALPDPVGWGLVLAGVWPLRSRLPQGGALVTLTGLALLLSVPLVLPDLAGRLSESGQWGVSVPQTVLCLLLCVTLAERAHEREASRFRLLRTTYVLVLAGPVLVYGGGIDALATPVAVLSVVANVALVYLTFAVSRRAYGRTEDSTSSARG